MALLWLVLGTGVIGMAATLALSVNWHRFVQGQGDFLAFYTGAVLVGTDGLYSPAANRETQLRLAGFTMDALRYIRLPFYAAALKPLALLPYHVAYWLFQALSIVAAIVFARLFRGPWQLTAAILLFFPLLAGIVVGQDITLVMVTWATAILLHRSGRETAAGLVLSLCIIKFHLFLLVPLALVRHRRWRMIGGATAGTLTLLVISTLLAGTGWPWQFLSALRDTAVTPHPEWMPSIRGAFSGSPLEIYAFMLACAVFIFVIAKLRGFEAAIELALVGGVLLNPHSYVQDCTFLIPALVSAIRHGTYAARGIALFLMTPIPYLLLLLGHGGVLLLAVIALAAIRSAAGKTPSGEICAA